MDAIFLKLLNMSINASWFVLAVVILRFLLKKAPKKLRVILWSLVGIRLVCPFSIESIFSFLPSSETIPENITMTPTPEIHSGIPALNTMINPILTETFAPNPGDSANPLQIITFIAAAVWIIGMLIMLIYTLVSYILIRKKTNEAIKLNDDIFVGDRIATPFILGVIKPKIYLPSQMNEGDREFVIAHEKAHIKRKDHLWKPLGFLLLTVYWFNPVLWLAYILLCRDIELACDEKVINNMGAEIKKPYAEALINCSVPRKLITACPVAFGETGVKGRIKSVLSYKKPAFWVIVLAVLASVAVAVGFMTDPKGDETYIFGKTYGGELVYEMASISHTSIYMGYCDISDDGRLSLAVIDHIVGYGKLKESDFDKAEFLSLLPDNDDGIFTFGDIVKAYEVSIPVASGNEQRLVIFITDDNRIYRANIAEGHIIAAFRLYETELFGDVEEPSLHREELEAILEHNKDNYYIAKNRKNFGDNTMTLSVVSYDGGHTIINAENGTRTIYTTMLYEEYVRDSQWNVNNVASQSSPVKLVFKEQKEGQYKLIKYVQPNPEMKGMPDDFIENLFNRPTGAEYDEAAIMKKLRMDCHDKATGYFGLFSSYSSDADYALYGHSDQNILIHRGNAFGSYYDPYVLGESVRLRHSGINMSGSIDPNDVPIYDYNLTFNEALSGNGALEKLKELCTNFDEDKHMLKDNDLYLINISVSYNSESDIKDYLPVAAFPAAVNNNGELINAECRFNLKSYTNETENGKASNWYPILVPKGQDFKAAFVIGSIFEAPGPTEMVYYDITTNERKPVISESSLNLYQDKITFDIDNDNVKENCYITAGPTSGIFTFCLVAFHNGQLEYFNIFAPDEDQSLSFKINEYTDKLQIIGDPQSETAASYVYTYHISINHSDVDGDNIMLNGLKYWGEQGIESPWADFTRGLQQMEYIDELRGRYPFYFDLPTDDGLALYVWQMSENNYQCALVSGKDADLPDKVIYGNESVSAHIMKYILESYDLPDEEIVIKPAAAAHSDYYYVIDSEYQQRINALFGR